MSESERKPWRTNVGLRLTKEAGLWFDAKCERELRPYANMVELLIVQAMRNDIEGGIK